MKQVNKDQRGSVSLETILLLGAVALPLLIFTMKYGWPRVRDYFFSGMETLGDETEQVINSNL